MAALVYRADEIGDFVDGKGNDQNNEASEHRIGKGEEFCQHHGDCHVQNINVKRRIFTEPFVVGRAVGFVNSEKELQKKDGGKNARHVHFKRSVGASEELVFGELQEKASDARDEIEVFGIAAFVKIEASECEAECEVGESEKQSVARVADRHIRILQKIHIACKEKVDQVADGNDDLVVMELVCAN